MNLQVYPLCVMQRAVGCHFAASWYAPQLPLSVLGDTTSASLNDFTNSFSQHCCACDLALMAPSAHIVSHQGKIPAEHVRPSEEMERNRVTIGILSPEMDPLCGLRMFA